VVVGVVLTVTVDVPAVVPVISTGVTAEHVAGLTAAVGVTAQARVTFPVNPPEGVTVTVAVSPVAAPAWKLIAPLLLSVMLGGVLTVTLTAVVELTVPFLPVTVMAYAPGVVIAVVETVRVPVSAAVPVMSTVGVTLQVAGLVGLVGVVVTAQVKLTSPVNPFDGVTVMLEVLPVVAPGNTVTPPLLLSANPGAVLVTWAFSPSV
jgi:hypothetical protein